MREELRKQAASWFKLPLAEITDWHIEVMIEQTLEINTSKDHERDVSDLGDGRISQAEYDGNEQDRAAYGNAEKARIAGLSGIQLGTPVPESVLLRRQATYDAFDSSEL
jgi:hypothetical protein